MVAVLVVCLVGRSSGLLAVEVSSEQFSPAIIQSVLPTAAELFQSGKTHYQAGQYQDAIDAWDRAAQLFMVQGDSLNNAMVSSNLALAHHQLGDWDAANGAISDSLNLLTAEPSAPSIRTNYHRVKAQTLNNQGILQLAQGQAKDAYGSWKEATTLYEQIEDEEGIIRSLINQAQALRVEGHYLQARAILQGDPQAPDAEQHPRDSVIYRLKTQPTSVLKATGLRMLGNILFLTGNSDKAVEILEESLTIAKQLGASEDVAATFLSLGNIAESSHEVDHALDYYQEAMITATTDLTRTQVQLYQLRTLIVQEKWLEAQELVEDLENQLARLPPSRSSIEVQINFAHSLLELSGLGVDGAGDLLRSMGPQSSRINNAVEQLVNARQKARQLKDKQAEAYALGTLAEAYSLVNQIGDAQRLSREAIGLAQSTHALDILYRWQWQLGRLYKTQYNNAPDNSNTSQDKLGKAVDAYDAAYSTLRKLQPDLAYSASNFRFTFRKDTTEPVYRELVDLLLTPTEPSQKNLFRAQQVMEALYISELENFLKRQCDLFLSLESPDDPNDLDTNMFEFSEDSDAAIVYPILLDERIELIYKLPGQKKLFHARKRIRNMKVEQLINQLKIDLEKEYTFDAVKEKSHTLYEYLLEPIREQLKSRDLKTLVFILDGGLRSIPMATLYDGQHYLIEDYGVAQSLSLQLTVPEKLPRRLRILAAGLTTDPPDDTFAKLQYVEQELLNIENTRMMIDSIRGDEFTLANLKSTLNRSDYQIVHLATHGRFGKSPDDTFLLAKDERITLDDFSTLLQTTDDDRSGVIELLVLSACETATGNDRAVLGMAGMAVQAVARSTIASLWSLDDSSGANFMGLLYQQLKKGGQSRAEALHQAQLQMLNDPRYKHPRYWAPYVLVGNWQ